jgi:hypothetical protein
MKNIKIYGKKMKNFKIQLVLCLFVLSLTSHGFANSLSKVINAGISISVFIFKKYPFYYSRQLNILKFSFC